MLRTPDGIEGTIQSSYLVHVFSSKYRAFISELVARNNYKQKKKTKKTKKNTFIYIRGRIYFTVICHPAVSAQLAKLFYNYMVLKHFYFVGIL